VYAVAFACVVNSMGIDLVDPSLPALSAQLDATPSQGPLLFTSHLLVTAAAMLGTGWVSSRIGAKRTQVTGLALDRRPRGTRRVLRPDRRHRRLPRGLGPGRERARGPRRGR
jgi:MFS family permease